MKKHCAVSLRYTPTGVIHTNKTIENFYGFNSHGVPLEFILHVTDERRV